MTRQLRIETIVFQRKSGADWEDGIIVNEGTGPIIDMDGQVVPAPVMDWKPRPIQLMTVNEGR